MAQMLLATAILVQYDRDTLIKQTLMIIEYHKKRNYVAWQSHRKRQIAILKSKAA